MNRKEQFEKIIEKWFAFRKKHKSSLANHPYYNYTSIYVIFMLEELLPFFKDVTLDDLIAIERNRSGHIDYYAKFVYDLLNLPANEN